MTEETAPTLSLEARQILLTALDAIRAEIAQGTMVNFALIRFNEDAQPFPLLVGNIASLHYGLTLAASILVQSSLANLKLRSQQPPPKYFFSHEPGRA